MGSKSDTVTSFLILCRFPQKGIWSVTTAWIGEAPEGRVTSRKSCVHILQLFTQSKNTHHLFTCWRKLRFSVRGMFLPEIALPMSTFKLGTLHASDHCSDCSVQSLPSVGVLRPSLRHRLSRTEVQPRQLVYTPSHTHQALTPNQSNLVAISLFKVGGG